MLADDWVTGWAESVMDPVAMTEEPAETSKHQITYAPVEKGRPTRQGASRLGLVPGGGGVELRLPAQVQG